MQLTQHRISKKAIIHFTEMISLLLVSGVPLDYAVEITKNSCRKEAQNLAQQISTGLRQGKEFHSVIDEIQAKWPKMYQGIIKAGEASGNLSTVLPDYIGYIQKEEESREKILSALLYPGIILLSTFIGIIAMVVVVFPAAEKLIQQLGGSISTPSALKTICITTAVPLSVILFTMCNRILRHFSTNGVTAFDRFLIHTPILGKIILFRQLRSWLFVMEIQLIAGIPFSFALFNSMQAISLQILKNDILKIYNNIIAGVPASQSFVSAKIIPAHIRDWLRISENIGKSSIVFHQLRLYYAAAADKQLQSVTAIAEPAAIIFAGSLLTGAIIAYVIPIFSMYGEIL